MDALFGALTLVAALGCGLIAGVFFAFSAFVMSALARLPAAQGIAAMQSINIVVINPWFLGVFLGTGGACIALIVSTFARWGGAGSAWVLAGSVLYLVGTIVVTMACNVPRNERLAAVDPATPDGARLWAEYVVGWTAWNHARAAAALVAAALLTLGLCARLPV